MRINGCMYVFGYVSTGLRIPVLAEFCISASTGMQLDGYTVICIQVCSGPPYSSEARTPLTG